ncbi:MAG: hypothetical protein QMD78_03880 [Methanocellales archaeon]|nr:hypothetical protein [Methanocellales archaeon]
MLCAILWFLIELYHNKTQTNKLKKSFLVGLFLMLFDFVVENSGKIAGLWEGYNSLFFVLYVPAEVMILCLVGGMAWALYLPERFDEVHSICDILLFSIFGALGEFILIKNGILAYMGGWTSIHAFMGYAVTWIILHALNYRIIKMK